MIHEIIKQYQYFSDGVIRNITYSYPIENKINATVQILCSNTQNNYEWELVKIIFYDILFFKFIAHGDSIGSVIDMALIKIENEFIVFDFFGLFNANYQSLEENPESEFVIKCKKIEYEVLE